MTNTNHETKGTTMKTRTRRTRTAVGTYLTLANGDEVQITGFHLSGNEGFFLVRYPDRIMTGDSYEIAEGEIYSAKFSKKYTS